MKKLRRVQLELSLKPFLSADADEVESVTRSLVGMWASLLRHAGELSILLFVGDGTELLQYDGNFDRRFPWAQCIGRVSDRHKVPDEKDPQHLSLDGQPHPFRDRIPEYSYGDLRRIVQTMKTTAGRLTGLKVTMGTILEPSGELVRSNWKYTQHPEVLFSGQGHMGFNIDCTSVLHADTVSYAGFPQGIPEGTPWGRFFGRQSRCFMRDMGFDYLWFSNGYGFGRSPYAYGACGEFFDGRDFHPKGNVETRDKILAFWEMFREECPEYPVSLRGTDYMPGMDWVNHATPHRELLDGRFNTEQPPNTPWPALTSNYGMAMASYMGRMSFAKGGIPYRLYTSDPWWANSAWVDSYNHSPHDIYLNLALAVIQEGGEVMTADSVAFLTVDTSWGEIPEWIPDEVIPHLKNALRHAPDQAGPLVWIYPFDEYESMTFDRPEQISHVFSGDLFIQESINNFLPLNTVVNSRVFIANQRLKADTRTDQIFIVPVPPAGKELEQTLLRLVRSGGRVLLYGALCDASKELMSMLHLQNRESVTGDFELDGIPGLDLQPEGTDAGCMRHQPAISGGGLTEVGDAGDDSQVLHTIRARGTEAQRVVARVCRTGDENKGILGWIRGSSSVDVESGALRFRSMTPFRSDRFFRSEKMMRLLLSFYGMELALDREHPVECARHLSVSRHRNAFRFTLFSEERAMKARLRFPLGAPILEGESIELKNGAACYGFHRFLHAECRLFIRQNEGNRVSCRIVQPMSHQYKHRVNLGPLKNATVCFFPPDGNPDLARVLLNPDLRLLTIGEPFDSSLVAGETGCHLEIQNVTGLLSFAW
ncbi:MAG: hypothetical protein WCQ57_01325 [Verrucomicrobiota bacterium]